VYNLKRGKNQFHQADRVTVARSLTLRWGTGNTCAFRTRLSNVWKLINIKVNIFIPIIYTAWCKITFICLRMLPLSLPA
jgi:hypothetical protein